jgi:hypothetical protein
MAIGVLSNNFREIFTELVKRSGASRYMISKYAHVDEPYIYHLLKGDKNNPSPEIVIRIGFALACLSNKITIYDLEELLSSLQHTIFPRESRRSKSRS